MSKSIYEFITESINENGKSSNASGKLPDDASFFSDLSFGFVGGAFEGIMPSGKTTAKSELRKAEKIIKSVQRFANNPSFRNQESMCKLLKERHSTSYLQAVVEGVKIRNDKTTRFYEVSKELLLTSSDRNIVKYSLYFMCFGNVEKDKEIVLNLAKHDEFTVHAIRAALLGFKEPNEIIFDIAKHVDGWGKISAVEYLEPKTDEIRNWLLRSGCSNYIMDNYLALICAENGNLLEAISVSQIDRELFNGAGIILRALVEDSGPAGSIEDYQKGAFAVLQYLNHASKMSDNLDDLLTVSAINDLVRREDILSDEMKSQGWTKDVIELCLPICEKILSDSKWPVLVWEHVESDDRVENFKGRVAARKLEIDIWECIFSKLQDIPEDDAHYQNGAFYYELANTDDLQRFQKLVDFAEVNLPLEKIACGPGNDMGLGLECKEHACLDTMLQNLRNKNGIGIKLIEAGLWSKVNRNRFMALSALETWDPSCFTDTIVSKLEALKKIEPDKEVKKRVIELLNNIE